MVLATKQEFWNAVCNDDAVDRVRTILDEYTKNMGTRKLKTYLNQGTLQGMLVMFNAESVRMFKLLQSYGADFTAKAPWAILIDHFAQNNRFELVVYLIESGWDFETSQTSPCVSFYRAIWFGNLEACKYLYKYIVSSKIYNVSMMYDCLPLAISYENLSIRNNHEKEKYTSVVRWIFSLKDDEDLLSFLLDEDDENELRKTKNPETRKMVAGRLLSSNILIMRSTLMYPRISRSRKLAKLPREMYELMAKMLI